MIIGLAVVAGLASPILHFVKVEFLRLVAGLTSAIKHSLNQGVDISILPRTSHNAYRLHNYSPFLPMAHLIF